MTQDDPEYDAFIELVRDEFNAACSDRWTEFVNSDDIMDAWKEWEAEEWKEWLEEAEKEWAEANPA